MKYCTIKLVYIITHKDTFCIRLAQSNLQINKSHSPPFQTSFANPSKPPETTRTSTSPPERIASIKQRLPLPSRFPTHCSRMRRPASKPRLASVFLPRAAARAAQSTSGAHPSASAAADPSPLANKQGDARKAPRARRWPLNNFAAAHTC